MEEEKLFRIGDVAKMFHISTGTLRHYERIGIVVPEFIEEKSSYRYYGIRQFEVLNTIRYLRVLDMPLEQIADFLANRDIQVIEEKLQNQKEMIREKKRQLEVIERKIDHRIHQIQDAASSKLDEIRMQQTKACRIVWIRDSLKIHSHLDLEYAIRCLEKDQPDSLTFLGKVGVGISEEKLENGETRVVLKLPAALAPVKLAVMPLVKKDGLPEKAREIIDDLKFHFNCQYDEKDSIGKRYRRQDAIGTPYCVTVDHQTLEDNCVTLRNRDTMEQERIKIEDLKAYFEKKFEW